jgi:imidazole glycerol-phosphate synthase subunit HisH
MIGVVDYGLGNVEAFLTMYKKLGFEVIRAKTKADLSSASRIILPGVGAFDHAIKLLNKSGMRETIENLVLGDKIPILGICVGMQMLATSSDEGNLPGLDWIPGNASLLSPSLKSASFLMPHMGWNSVIPKKGHPLFINLEQEAKFYFLHSYYFECDDILNKSANVFYGFDFACSVSSGNIHGVQFHPEKSHHFGTQLLKNFAEI